MRNSIAATLSTITVSLVLTLSSGAQETKPNTAVIPVPKLEDDRYDWNARHAEILRIKESANPEIVLIGDSITHFWGGEPKSDIANGPKAWNSVFGDRRVLNLGFGWDRTQNVLWRIDHGELDGIHPRFVVVQIGTNNTSGTANARENTAAEIAAGVMEICTRIRRALPEAKIILTAIFPREGKPDHSRRKLIDATNRLLAAAPRDPQITWLDIGPKMLAADGTLEKAMMADFCHPSEQGYQIWADALRPLIPPISTP